jgi:hypothetical protein
MIQEPDFGGLMPDTFEGVDNNSYGGGIDDYQSRVDDFDLRGPNAQYLPFAGFEREEEPEDDCCDKLASANSTINCLADKLLPKELNGSLSWSYSATSTRPDFGPPYGPSNPEPCTKTITSNIQVEFVSGIQLKFCREDNRIPEDCGASGYIGWSISLNKDGSNGIPITWSDTPNGQQSCATRNSTLNTTYYIFAAGLNLNENGPPQAYRYMGSFFVSSGGEITRTVNTVNEFIEGDPLPCGLEPEEE